MASQPERKDMYPWAAVFMPRQLPMANTRTVSSPNSPQAAIAVFRRDG